MTDEELIRKFEDRTLPSEVFRHRVHVKIAWLYLNRYSKLEALERFTTNLRNFAAHLGKPQLYHETITWGHIFLIHERMMRAVESQNWEEFSEANADLLNWRDGIFKQYYSQEVIASELARSTFVLPDRCSHL